MGNLSDPARSRSELAHRIAELERQVTELQTSRPLEAASIGSGGLRLVGGDITVDEGGNVLVIGGGRIIAGDPDGDRAEITSLGYRLVNADGEVDIDLTTQGAANLIRLRGAGQSSGEEQENEILLTNDGQINGRVLTVDEIIIDGQNLANILKQLADAATPTSEGADPEPPPPSGTITRTYTATWSQVYKGTGKQNGFASGLNQGQYTSTNGNQKSLIGFPSSTIQSDHAGRTVTRVRVFLYYKHWFNNSGGTAIIGHHGHSSAPSTFSATTDQVRSSSWPKPGGRTVTYNVGIQSWVTGAKKGIAIGPGPSISHLYYGTAHKHNQSRPPRLEIRSVA